MSDATSEIWTRDGETRIGYTIYQGSADMVSPGVYPTLDEAWDNRRRLQPGVPNPWDVLRDCNHEDDVEAWLYSHYGGGDHWPTTVCGKCSVITGRLSPYILDYGYRGPTAKERAEDEQWLAGGWPKDGPPPGVRVDED